MMVTASPSVAPLDDPSVDFDAEISKVINALDKCDIKYETHPVETTLEAESLDAVLNAAKTATEAVDATRVSMHLKVDHLRDETLDIAEKVDRVEAHLGRSARSNQ